MEAISALLQMSRVADGPRPLVVFDLDNTLITSVFRGNAKHPEDERWYPPTIRPDMSKFSFLRRRGKPISGIFDIYARPWSGWLLGTALENARVGVWTFAHYEWAQPILAQVFDLQEGKELEFLYTSDRPPGGYRGPGKPLRVIEELHRGPTIIVEDTPENCIENPEASLIVPRDDCHLCLDNCPRNAYLHCRTSMAYVDKLIKMIRNN